MDKTKRGIVARNLDLVERVLHYLLKHPSVLDALPESFEVIVLPENDPELRVYNLELLDKYRQEGRPVVLVRVSEADKREHAEESSIEVYVPLAA